MTHHVHDDRAPRGGGFIIGLLAGAAVGSGIALLFAPRQGADIRHDLVQGAQQAGRRLNEAYGTVAESARRNARRLANQAEGLRESFRRDVDVTSGQAYDRAADASRVLRDAVGEATYTPTPTGSSEGPSESRPADPFGTRSPLV